MEQIATNVRRYSCLCASPRGQTYCDHVEEQKLALQPMSCDAPMGGCYLAALCLLSLIY